MISLLQGENLGKRALLELFGLDLVQRNLDRRFYVFFFLSYFSQII